MKAARTISVSLFALLIAGCGATLIDTKPTPVGDRLVISPQVEWTNLQTNQSHVTLWTIDGAGLDSLFFFTDIEDGDPLMPVQGTDKVDLRPYRSSMLPDDICELVAYTLTKNGAQEIKTSNLKPVPFGNQQGFRFDLSYVTGTGLRMKGTALATQPGGKLDVILFAAPEEYYFDHYVPTVDKVYSTVTIN